MNQIILYHDDFIEDSIVRLSGRRLQHMLCIHHAEQNDILKVGVLNGSRGQARVLSISANEVIMRTTLTDPPPPPLALTLIIALPRPKIFKKVLQYSAALGIKKIYVLRTWRVEKSYLQSPVLAEENIREQLVLGLEQACDTMLPEVHIKKLFRPFVEDELPEVSKNSHAYVAHPVAALTLPRIAGGSVTLAIGPEGGFIPFEVELLCAAGLTPVTLGERILRVDTVLPYIIGRMF